MSNITNSKYERGQAKETLKILVKRARQLKKHTMGWRTGLTSVKDILLEIKAFRDF